MNGPTTTDRNSDELSRVELAQLLVASCLDINAGSAEIRLEGVTDGGRDVGDWLVTVNEISEAPLASIPAAEVLALVERWRRQGAGKEPRTWGSWADVNAAADELAKLIPRNPE